MLQIFVISLYKLYLPLILNFCTCISKVWHTARTKWVHDFQTKLSTHFFHRIALTFKISLNHNILWYFFGRNLKKYVIVRCAYTRALLPAKFPFQKVFLSSVSLSVKVCLSKWKLIKFLSRFRLVIYNQIYLQSR